ncbi:MAG: phosphoribosyltransferase family protein, partial [bacterium]|nr:phosphoribosyltransferase family protein [bacterium]
MFKNRQEAGQLLAQKLKKFKGQEAVVLGLARGGVVVAKEVANILNAPLDALVVKKIGAPGNPELAIGAVGPKRVTYWDDALCQRLGISEYIRNQELGVRNQEREDREKLLRGKKPYLKLKGKTVVLVDDGIATGATTLAAISWIKSQNPGRVILAVPVAPADTVEKLKPQV